MVFFVLGGGGFGVAAAWSSPCAQGAKEKNEDEMVAIADLMEEAKRVAALCEADALRSASSSGPGVGAGPGTGAGAGVAGAGVAGAGAGAVGPGPGSGSGSAPTECECIGFGGTLTRVTLLASPTQTRVPVQHSPSTHRFPPLSVDGVDDVFAKCKRLAHLRTSIFGVYDGYAS